MSKIYFILATSYSSKILVLMFSVGQQSGEITKLVNSGDHSREGAGILKTDFSRMGSQFGKLFCEFRRFPPYRKSFFSLLLILSH